MKYRPIGYLTSSWNQATNPAIARTEHMHKRCAIWAIALDRRMCAAEYVEISNGARYPRPALDIRAAA